MELEKGVIEFNGGGEIEVRGPRDYYIEIYGNQPKFIKVTQEQRDKINKVLLESEAKFIQIGEKTINVSAIKEMGKSSSYGSGTV